MEQYTPDWAGYLRTVGILLGLLILFAYISIRLKTKNLPKWALSSLPTQGEKQIEVLERKVIEPGKSLFLIELAGQKWLIGTTPTDIRLIGKLENNNIQKDLYGKRFSDYLQSQEET